MNIISKCYWSQDVPLSGADPGFFLGGGALVSCSTSTPINHIVCIFFCRIPVVLENCRSPREGGGGVHPLHPPPRSAPDYCGQIMLKNACCQVLASKIANSFQSKPSASIQALLLNYIQKEVSSVKFITRPHGHKKFLFKWRMAMEAAKVITVLGLMSRINSPSAMWLTIIFKRSAWGWNFNHDLQMIKMKMLHPNLLKDCN